MSLFGWTRANRASAEFLSCFTGDHVERFGSVQWEKLPSSSLILIDLAYFSMPSDLVSFNEIFIDSRQRSHFFVSSQLINQSSSSIIVVSHFIHILVTQSISTQFGVVILSCRLESLYPLSMSHYIHSFIVDSIRLRRLESSTRDNLKRRLGKPIHHSKPITLFSHTLHENNIHTKIVHFTKKLK